jgi:hypothetical protein
MSNNLTRQLLDMHKHIISIHRNISISNRPKHNYIQVCLQSVSILELTFVPAAVHYSFPTHGLLIRVPLCVFCCKTAYKGISRDWSYFPTRWMLRLIRVHASRWRISYWTVYTQLFSKDLWQWLIKIILLSECMVLRIFWGIINARLQVLTLLPSSANLLSLYCETFFF